MKTVLKCVVSGAAALTLACGGGQSGPDISYSGAKTVVTIDESNVGTMTSMASASASSLAGGSYGGGYLKTGAAAQSDLRATTSKALSLLAAARKSSAVALTGVSGSYSEGCAGGGSITYSFSQQDPQSDVVHNGDWGQVSFNQCRLDTSSPETLSGSVRMLAINVDGDFPSSDDPTLMTPGFPYKVRLTLNDFAVIESDGAYAGVSADMTMSVLWNAATFELSRSVSGSSVATVAHDGTQVVEASLLTAVPGTAGYAFDAVDTYSDAYASSLVANTWGMSARMCSLDLAGCLDVVIDPAFFQRLVDPYPDAGTFRITGASGAYVELTALDGVTGDVTLTWDLDGAGAAFAPVTVSTTWDCLNTPGLCQP